MAETIMFSKQPRSNEELADLLVSRGLIADKPTLIHLLDSIGYYRLTGYLASFRNPDGDGYRSGSG